MLPRLFYVALALCSPSSMLPQLGSVPLLVKLTYKPEKQYYYKTSCPSFICCHDYVKLPRLYVLPGSMLPQLGSVPLFSKTDFKTNGTIIRQDNLPQLCVAPGSVFSQLCVAPGSVFSQLYVATFSETDLKTRETIL